MQFFSFFFFWFLGFVFSSFFWFYSIYVMCVNLIAIEFQNLFLSRLIQHLSVYFWVLRELNDFIRHLFFLSFFFFGLLIIYKLFNFFGILNLQLFNLPYWLTLRLISKKLLYIKMNNVFWRFFFVKIFDEIFGAQVLY